MDNRRRNTQLSYVNNKMLQLSHVKQRETEPEKLNLDMPRAYFKNPILKNNTYIQEFCIQCICL